ncbi:MAG: DUF4870 domain-containing protein [Peptococcaceae bacterium]
MFCPQCGKESSEAKFCSTCGAKMGNAAEKSTGTSGLQDNIAGLLSYLVGWITGLVLLLIDRRPFVRFHAIQSIITFGSLTVLNILIGLLPYSLWRMLHPITGIIYLAGLILWVLLMVKAYQGLRYKLPLIGEMAERYANSSKFLED